VSARVQELRLQSRRSSPRSARRVPANGDDRTLNSVSSSRLTALYAHTRTHTRPPIRLSVYLSVRLSVGLSYHLSYHLSARERETDYLTDKFPMGPLQHWLTSKQRLSRELGAVNEAVVGPIERRGRRLNDRIRTVEFGVHVTGPRSTLMAISCAS
jgi:hypothetical protein